LQSLGCCRFAKRNIAVVDIPGLHAKVYIGQKGIVVASANTSADGLGEEDDILCDGLEAGYVSNKPEDINAARRWFEAILKKGKPIRKADLTELEVV
jgi:hypothetical protein